MISEGDAAPEFTLPADDGSTVSLGSLGGRLVVLYFYPKDNTSGCTVEACEFRDAHPSFESAGAVVFGVSPDGLRSHEKFKAKHELPFLLLSDEDHSVAEAYGVWKEKSMYGRKYWGIERSTFLIGPDGKVIRAWRKVKAKGHAEEVDAAVKAAS